MLEGVLEQLLLQYLAPYVDGISRDKLHVGVVSGAIELKDLKVQPDALAKLGMETLRVRSGRIGVIKISIPWRKLYSGKLQASVEDLKLEVESIAADLNEENASQLINEIREAKRKAVGVRMHQLADLLQQKDEAEEGSNQPTKKKGLGVKLARKILHNITINLTGVSVAFINIHRGFACALEFPTLAVLSTDETFHERADREEVVVSGNSMYKLLRLRDLSLRMSPAGNADLADAQYVISPLSASMKIAHEPIASVLRVRLEVATEQLAELTLRRSQVKHLRGLRVDIEEEERRLFERMVPLAEERVIFSDPKHSRDEYSQLYERQLRWEWISSGEDVNSFGGVDRLTEKEERYMQLLEDAFSIRVLARARLKVQNKLEALNQEVARRILEAEKSRWDEERKKASIWDRFRRKGPQPENDSQSLDDQMSDDVLLTAEERDQLLADFEDESKVETVDLPQTFKIEFVVGKMALDLVDDQWREQTRQQLMQLALVNAHWTVDVGMATDHRGRDSAEWRMELALSSFKAFHKGQALFKFCTATDELGEVVEVDNGFQLISNYEPTGRAASLVVESRLLKDMNLMKLTFEFEPVEIHMLPGVVELVLEFWRPPRQLKTGVAADSPMDDGELRLEDLKEITRQYLTANSEKAKRVAEQVYERIPDRIQFNVNIASPILHVPVPGLGTAVASLGRLSMTTPVCSYSSIDMEWLLDQTKVTAKSRRGECVDMIQPVPVRLTVEYRGLEEENQISLNITAKEMFFSLSPQALQILLCTPGALLQILYPVDESAGKCTTEANLDHTTGSTATASFTTSLSAHAQDGVSNGGTHAEPQTITKRASSLAQEVLGNEGENIIQAAALKVDQVRRKQFRLNMGVQWDALDVTLADSIVPVMRFRMELMESGLVMYQQSIPYMMTMTIGNCMLEVDVLNPRNGSWEPLAERFHLGIEIERKQATEDQRSSHVIINGHEPLLLNFTPVTLQRAGWITPLFVQSVTFSLPERFGEEAASLTGEKYRVVNLCDEAIELHFRSKHHKNLIATIRPTGSAWVSLDEWVLPHFATAVAAKVEGGKRFSEMLSLERVGAVAIPSSGYVAELYTPDPSHRLLLLATPLRVHNQTDISLHVRFHDGAHKSVLALDLAPSIVCDAALLGKTVPNYAVQNHLEGAHGNPQQEMSSGFLELAPNSICAVPAPALIREGGSSINNSYTILSVKPVGSSVEFCKPQRAGAKASTSTLTCYSHLPIPPGRGLTVGERPIKREINFLCTSLGTHHALPFSSQLNTIALQPTLALLNALPFGKLEVRYAQYSGPESVSARRHWREVQVPCFTRLNIYNFPGQLSDGIGLQARLTHDAPWSAEASFTPNAIQEADCIQTLNLRQTRDGGAAGVAVEPLNSVEIRLSCPAWFIDRSGLPKSPSLPTLELRYFGDRLPQENGITLLPTDVMEEPCDLVLCPAGHRQNIMSSKTVRLPPSWTVFPWKTGPNVHFVFCVQVDDIKPTDVLGAQCQIMTLRPRLVLTNASQFDIEVRISESRQMRLPAGRSKELHWQVKEGDEDQPNVNLRFRPAREAPQPQCQWSGTVVCGDSTAGSTAFALAKLDDRNRAAAVGQSGKDSLATKSSSRSLEVEVWSVDIAPVRGALSVTFREGSDFVATNNCRGPLRMALRPHGCDDSVASIPMPMDTEISYGWMRPFSGHQRRSVDILINDSRIQIEDVRRTIRRISKSAQIAVTVSRAGTRTVLTVQDLESNATSQRAVQKRSAAPQNTTTSPINSTKLIQVDIKVSRIGVSLVEQVPHARELLYLHLELIRFTFSRMDNDVRTYMCAISEGQVDCQLPGRVDAQSADRRRSDSLALYHRERPAVILANCADGDRAFLTFFLQRGATSSRDILLHKVEIEMDALDITIDDGWLDPLVAWIDNTRSDNAPERGTPVQQIRSTADRSILEGYDAPPVPFVVQVDQLSIGAVNITMWAWFKIKSVRFLPPYVRTAIRVLSFSGQFTLDGANLFLPQRSFPAHRGSLKDFLKGLATEYTLNLINNVAQMLGKSSVLNLPRAPLKFGSTVMSYLTDTVGLAAGEAASLMAQLTFDDDYIARQRQVRDAKRIQGFSDGVVEAGKSIAEGLEGVADLWKKPMEAQKKGDNLQGIMSSVGRGLAGSFLKPISKLGQAISDVGSGIAASATPDTASMKRRRARHRQRHPRLLFTQLGAIRPWSELEADVLHQLGPQLAAGVEEVLILEEREQVSLKVLLLFSNRLLIVALQPRRRFESASRHGQGRRTSGHGYLAARGEHSSNATSTSVIARDAATSSSASSSRSPAAESKEKKELFEAMDDAALALFSQAVKPINTLVYGVQDMEAQLNGEPIVNENAIDPDLRKRARDFFFKDLRAVHLNDKSEEILLQLEDTRGGVHTLPLSSAPFGTAVRQALAAGFRTSLENANHTANWDQLRGALLAEQREHHDSQMTASPSRKNRKGVGERILEVFEVERRYMGSTEWKTPFMPTDRELAYKWVDATGTRHPHIIKTYTREECSTSRVPPCALEVLFRPTSDWVIYKGQDTDSEGWKYGLAWNSSTWDVKPGIFDVIRKRRWSRSFE